MLLTADHLASMSQSTSKANDNIRSVIIGLQHLGREAGLQKPQLLPHYLCQMGHESMGWHYDREVWGPTAAQKRYEGRKDLGNILPGDGALFSGKGPFQVTGRGNTTDLYNWCVDRFGSMIVPDFVKDPSKINTDPWEGISALWYWITRDLNYYASQNNLEAVTRKINGGVNGLVDRYAYYTRCALVLLGYKPTQVREFQIAAGFTGKDVDGIAGSATRAALHKALGKMPDVTFEPEAPIAVEPSPQMDLVAKAETLMLQLQEIIKTIKENQK